MNDQEAARYKLMAARDLVAQAEETVADLHRPAIDRLLKRARQGIEFLIDYHAPLTKETTP